MVLEMARSGSMYEIQNIEVIMNTFIRSFSSNPKKTDKQPPGWKPLPPTLNIVKKHIKSIPSNLLSLLAEPKQIVREESANTCIAGIDTH